MNRNAYIQIAISGKDFCGAMRDSFSIISSNFLRFSAVHGLGGIFVFIGILFITFLNTFFCYLIMSYSDVNN